MTGKTGIVGEAGLAALIVQIRPELLRFLAARCGNADTAQDLLQDLWLKLGEVETGPIANPRAYLFRMANNLALDHARAQRRGMVRDRRWIDSDFHDGSKPSERPDPALQADEAMVNREEAEILHRAISGLPPGARKALQLYRIEGRKQSEIAEIMGISRSGVEKHLSLAMRQLRDALANCGFFGSAASIAQDKSRGGDSRQGKQV